MTFNPTKIITPPTIGFHFFAYQEYTCDTLNWTFQDFLDSSFFTYTSNHRAHCCGPFDNRYLKAEYFFEQLSEGIYKEINLFFEFYKDVLPFIPNSTEAVFTQEVENLEAIKLAADEVIRMHPPISETLYTVGYFKNYENQKRRLQTAIRIEEPFLHEFAPVFEYYKFFVGVSKEMVQVYYFCWD